MKTGMTEGKTLYQELSRDHRLALETLLAFDSRIRCAVEVRFNGEQITSACRKGLESLEPEEKTGKVLDQIAIGAGMGSSMNGYHGRVRAVIVVRERVSLIVFPLFESLILVSADPEFPLQKTRQMARLLDIGSPSGLEADNSLTAQNAAQSLDSSERHALTESSLLT